MASKINNSLFSLSLSLDSKYQSVGGEDKAGKPEEAGREPPERMGPAHTSRDSRRELKPRKRRRRNTTRPRRLCPNKPPIPSPKNPAVWKVLVAARGGSTPRNPKGILLLSARCFPLGCCGKGFAGVKSPENPAWLQIQRIWPLRAACFSSVGSQDPGELDPRLKHWQQVDFGGQPHAGTKMFTRRRRRPGLTLPGLLCRQSLPMWLLGEARGFESALNLY